MPLPYGRCLPAGQAPISPAPVCRENCLVAVGDPMWRDVDEAIDRACREAVGRLEAAGATVEWHDVDEFTQAMAIARVLVSTDAWVVLVRPGGRGAGKDLRVHAAPVPGPARRRPGHEVLKVLRELDALAASLHRKLAGCDALLAPTVPRSPPAIAESCRQSEGLHLGQRRNAEEHHARQPHETLCVDPAVRGRRFRHAGGLDC